MRVRFDIGDVVQITNDKNIVGIVTNIRRAWCGGSYSYTTRYKNKFTFHSSTTPVTDDVCVICTSANMWCWFNEIDLALISKMNAWE